MQKLFQKFLFLLKSKFPDQKPERGKNRNRRLYYFQFFISIKTEFQKDSKS